MHPLSFHRKTLTAALAAALALPATAGAQVGRRWDLFTISNAATGNQVVRFEADFTGGLRHLASYPTRVGDNAASGLGTGGGLGNQGALALGMQGRLLVTVNPGSDEITAFEVDAGGDLAEPVTVRVSAGGSRPVSVTTHGNLVYVLNQGRAASGPTAANPSAPVASEVPSTIDALAYARRGPGRGVLFPLALPHRNLSAEAFTNPAQIEVTPGRDALVITEKATDRLVTFPLHRYGFVAGPAHVVPSLGRTPFGFAFDRSGSLLVSEAFGGADSKVGAYAVGARGNLTPRTGGSLDLGDERAACWVAVKRGFAFVTNTATNSVSRVRLDPSGVITASAPDTRWGLSDGAPLDMALSPAEEFLYVLKANGQIDVFDANARGTLNRPLRTLTAHVPLLAGGRPSGLLVRGRSADGLVARR